MPCPELELRIMPSLSAGLANSYLRLIVGYRLRINLEFGRNKRRATLFATLFLNFDSRAVKTALTKFFSVCWLSSFGNEYAKFEFWAVLQNVPKKLIFEIV